MLFKKITWLFLFLIGSVKLSGQADQKLNTLFFGLEMDSSLTWLQQKLRKDIRFRETTGLPELPMLKYAGSYVSLQTSSLLGADSSHLFLNVLLPALVNRLEAAPHAKDDTMVFTVTHYFHSFDQAYSTYEAVGDLLTSISEDHKAHHDQDDASIYHDFKLEEEKKVRTLLATDANGNFKLLLSYSCRTSH